MPQSRFEPAITPLDESKTSLVLYQIGLLNLLSLCKSPSDAILLAQSNFEIAPKLHNIHKGTSGLSFLNVFTMNITYR